MKFKAELKLLLLTLCLMAAVPVGMMLRPHQSISHSGFYYDSSVEGDRFALAYFAADLEHKQGWTLISYEYRTPAADGKRHLGVKPSANPYGESGYRLLYNRREKTLTKKFYDQFPSDDDEQPTKTWRWQNVEENAIHQIVAPMRDKDGAIFNEKVSAYQGGKLEELEIYGAILAPETDSR